MRAISIRQPWAHLIVHGKKRIENRSWTTAYRGPLLIHAAGRRPRVEDLAAISRAHGVALPEDFDHGAFIGVADLVEVITQSDSPWFCGRYGLVLRNVRPIDPIPAPGRLKLFVVNRETLASVRPPVQQSRPWPAPDLTPSREA